MPPEDVASAAVYLLSDAGESVTVTAAGDEISILSEPRQIRTGVAQDSWTVDAVGEAFDSITEGYDLTRTDRFL
jgi:hypothetical protein